MTVGISGYVGNKLTGIGRVLIEILNELASLNRDDEYILFKNFDFNDYDVLKRHCNIRFVDINISKDSSIKNILWHQWNFQKLQKKYKCDIAYIPNFSLLVWKRIPTIVTIHDLIEYNVKNKFSKARMMYRKMIDPLMVKNSTFITTVSECSKHDIIKFCNAKEKNIAVIPNAADGNRFKKYAAEVVDSCLKKFNLIRKGYVLFVGTIDYPGKNIMSAIEGYEHLREKHDIKEKLVIVGKDGFNAQVIYDHVNQSKFKNDIIFTGYISDDDLPLLYSGAKVMIYLSLYEGFGLPVLEAMSCGTAVLSSNTSCFPEVIGDIDVGVAPTDIDAMEKKLYQLIADDNYNKKIAEQCYERSKLFSWKESAKKYYEIFKKYSNK
jgi:glycosyltransferase involved in cell wall biosynthesis